MSPRPFTLQAVDPFSGRKLGPARTFTPPEQLASLAAAEAPAPAEPEPGEPYPEGGTIEQVLAWVDDPAITDAVRSERAKAAVVAEHGRDKPRKTLLQELSERTG